MLFYFLQTSLMLLVSYFLGCWLGCTLRNTFGSREPVPVRSEVTRPVAPAPASMAPGIAPALTPARPPSIAPTPRAGIGNGAGFPAHGSADLQSRPPRRLNPRRLQNRRLSSPLQPPPAQPVGSPARPSTGRATTFDSRHPRQPCTGVSVTAAAAAAAAAAVAQGRARETTIGKPPADAILPAASIPGARRAAGCRRFVRRFRCRRGRASATSRNDGKRRLEADSRRWSGNRGGPASHRRAPLRRSRGMVGR